MILRRLWVAFVVAAGAVAVWPGGGAGAVAPYKAAYWAQVQSSSLPATIPVPANPAVPQGGLYVANTPDGPKAIAAVAYEVDGEVSADLVLKVHSFQSSASPVTSQSPQQPPSPEAQTAHLSACVAEGDWAPTADGSPGVWEHRPSFDPANCVFGQFSADGATVDFPLGPERQQSHGVFNLVIVPDPALTGQSNTPFSVTFEAPGETSLLAGEPVPAEEEEPEPVFDPAPPESDFEPGTFSEFTGTTETETPAVFTTPTTTARPAPSPIVRLSPRAARPAVAVPDGRGERVMAVSLLMALAVAWWWFGGQQTRGPQLLGSLAGEGRRAHRSAEPTGGVGRFARPREGRPRPLI